MSNEREREAMLRARAFIDRLTVDAPDGDPKAIVEDENRFFAWDNEHRSPKTGKTFLFDWSYYIGIVIGGAGSLPQSTGKALGITITCTKNYSGE